MNGGSSVSYLALTPYVPLFYVLRLIGVETEGLVDYWGGGGSCPLCSGTFARLYSVPKQAQAKKKTSSLDVPIGVHDLLLAACLLLSEHQMYSSAKMCSSKKVLKITGPSLPSINLVIASARTVMNDFRLLLLTIGPKSGSDLKRIFGIQRGSL